jgi:ATP-binding cassette subfamily F protein uup
MPLVALEDVTIRFRGPALLDGVNCLIEPKQRIGLLGRNGAGKSTLLRMLTGGVEPDHGKIVTSPGARIALLTQAVPENLAGEVHSIVAEGVQAKPGEALDDWEKQHLVDQILSQMELEPTAEVAAMSAGMKRRVLLAKALVQKPDLLLLDEPTNHLDISSIRWLEDFLARFPNAFMFITHDRSFLRRLANRILEIEGGKIFDWTCDYETFLKRKEAEIAAQEKQDKLFDKKLAEEEAWIRQGIKARRTRNEGRVRALKELRKIRSERREKVGTSNLQIQESLRSGNLVLKADQISFAYPTSADVSAEAQKSILQDFSITVQRGDKIGIVGPNGVGKTTFLKLLLGELAPDSGSVRLGSNLQIAYFDQLRQQLDEQKTVEEDVSDGYQTVQVAGSSRHVLGYLQDFLFTPERARTKIAHLSGGERNRVLLAKLFTKPANVIVLDEPTNDLDAETIEMLEERLVSYSGTLLMVSHDREFLNNVVTSTVVFEEVDGHFQPNEYVGGYDDWFRIAQTRSSNTKTTASDKIQTDMQNSTAPSPPKNEPNNTKKKLSFKEQKELEKIPLEIESLEKSIAEIHELMGDAEFYKRPGEDIAETQTKLTSLQEKLEAIYQRWEELESLA